MAELIKADELKHRLSGMQADSAAPQARKGNLDLQRTMPEVRTAELKNRLKKIPEWELEKKHIERTFEFDEFSEAIDFVNSVAEVAEDEEHHPDIDIRFNKVRLILSTHSKGGLTDLDFGLAERIDTLSE